MALIIRDSQLPLLTPFYHRVAELLVQQFPDAGALPEDELYGAIDRQVNAAKTHGLFTEKQFATYVVAAYILGEDFADHFPEAAAILKEDTAASIKAERLSEWTVRLLQTLEAP